MVKITSKLYRPADLIEVINVMEKILDDDKREASEIVKRFLQAWSYEIVLIEPSEDYDMQPPLDERYTRYALIDQEIQEIKAALTCMSEAKNIVIDLRKMGYKIVKVDDPK